MQNGDLIKTVSLKNNRIISCDIYIYIYMYIYIFIFIFFKNIFFFFFYEYNIHNKEMRKLKKNK